MSDYISLDAAIDYIREQSEEMSKAFEELGGEIGIYADAYNDLAEDFHRIHAADVAPVVHCKDCVYSRPAVKNCEDMVVCIALSKDYLHMMKSDFCSYGKFKEATIGIDTD